MPPDQHGPAPEAAPDASQASPSAADDGREAQLARRLAELPAGVALLTELDQLDLDELTAFERVEVVVAAGRLEALAHAIKARAAAALDRHPDMRPPRGRPLPGAALVARHLTGATLAMRLQASTHEAETLVREGIAYAGVLADTGAALSDGQIDVPRARAIVRGLADEPVPVATAAQDLVLPRAPGRTPAQVRQDIARALNQVDGEHAVDRHRDARRGRAVYRPRALQHGMAGTWLVLPAVTAVQVDAALDAAARRARSAGDERTFDQLRADELCDRVLGRGDVPEGGDDAAARAAARTQRDGSFELLEPSDDAKQAGSSNGAASVGHGEARARVLVTVPLSTLMDLDDQPGDIDGFGPVDAVQARALALGGVWRRVVTDDLSGTVLDVGRTTYRPPAALAEHVRVRDRTCVAPGCSVPASRSDLDHTEEWDEPREGEPPRPPGATAATNLGPLCRHHHRLKTTGAFALRQRSAGEFDWRTPSGHAFRVHPGTDAPVVHLTAPQPEVPPPF
ncbi:DUF222 domain-containing protein [Cellulomonas sp. NPDC058312]|uniref:HNH endonuclease signature motif containing protein n=1 Tax=Cellulomonas sp. NPDC058312 TaxID=3346441 RepID=UPI0036E78FCE